MVDKEEHLKQMADLLKSGARMLEDHCPECNSPLFLVKGTVWCPKCQKKVIIIKEGEEPPKTVLPSLNNVESIILTKIQETSKLIMEEKDIENLEKLSNLLLKWLDVLEKSIKIQKT
ncbi:MAG: Sjogren's syndrome/scleroderma autoantigen 1 family protein [Candidatus Bathyarchaeota archaeon]